jgi:hypothetical protein
VESAEVLDRHPRHPRPPRFTTPNPHRQAYFQSFEDELLDRLFVLNAERTVDEDV